MDIKKCKFSYGNTYIFNIRHSLLLKESKIEALLKKKKFQGTKPFYNESVRRRVSVKRGATFNTLDCQERIRKYISMFFIFQLVLFHVV